mmetsp:Transcript_17290/g.25926  ORF Transcript_17290/g.25926 Transcript_17290/m.25926 type:complete len:720 (+) Transcript_17290:28-2187(+)
MEHPQTSTMSIDVSKDAKAYKKRYEELGEIGSGASSIVRLCKDRITGEELAVKIMSRENTPMDEEKFGSEISIMRALNHPHIMGVKDVYKTETHIRVVMELATGGELFDRICDQNSFEEKQAQKLAKDLFGALAYMHSKGVAHRDLKPENILYLNEKEDSPVKIADFGFAKMSGKGKKGRRRRMNTQLGTQGYSAPEVFSGGEYTEKCDVWSMGVVIHILLCGLPPFIEIDENEIDEAFNCPFWVYVNQMINDPEKLKLEFHPQLWGHVSKSAKDFLRKLFVIDPDLRPSAEDLLKHEWMSSTFKTNNLKTTVAHLRRFKQDKTISSTIDETKVESDKKIENPESPQKKKEESNNMTAPPPTPNSTLSCGVANEIRTWGEEKVEKWISSLGASPKWKKYGDIIKKEGVDGVSLLHANDEVLIDIGFSRLHARVVCGEIQSITEAASKLEEKQLLPSPLKIDSHGTAYAVNAGVDQVLVYDGPGYEHKRIGRLGKGSVVHSLAEEKSGWIKHRLGWSPRKDQSQKVLLSRVLPLNKKKDVEKSGKKVLRFSESSVDVSKQLFSGMLMKRSKHLRGWFRRFFVLYPDRILYYRPGATEARGVIHLAVVKAVTVVGKYQLNIVAGTKTVALKAGSKADRFDWIEKIQDARIQLRTRKNVRFMSPSSRELKSMEKLAQHATRSRRESEAVASLQKHQHYRSPSSHLSVHSPDNKSRQTRVKSY